LGNFVFFFSPPPPPPIPVARQSKATAEAALLALLLPLSHSFGVRLFRFLITFPASLCLAVFCMCFGASLAFQITAVSVYTMLSLS
jgi:hypothetical protein